MKPHARVGIKCNVLLNSILLFRHFGAEMVDSRAKYLVLVWYSEFS